MSAGNVILIDIHSDCMLSVELEHPHAIVLRHMEDKYNDVLT